MALGRGTYGLDVAPIPGGSVIVPRGYWETVYCALYIRDMQTIDQYTRFKYRKVGTENARNEELEDNFGG